MRWALRKKSVREREGQSSPWKMAPHQGRENPSSRSLTTEALGITARKKKGRNPPCFTKKAGDRKQVKAIARGADNSLHRGEKKVQYEEENVKLGVQRRKLGWQVGKRGQLKKRWGQIKERQTLERL